MYNLKKLTDYNFDHGLHRGQNGFYRPILPEDLNRPLTHDEMDYNIQLIGGIIGGYRVIGTGTDGELDVTNDANKSLKLYKVTSNDTEIIDSGSKINDLVWIADTGVLFSGEVNVSLIPDQDEAYDLGSPTKKFRDLYLSNNTLYLGSNTLSMIGGTLQVNGSPVAAGSELLDSVNNVANLLGIETSIRTEAITDINSQINLIADENSATAQSVLDLDTQFTADLTNAITGESLARTEAISTINQTLTSLSNANEAISQSITDLSAEFNTEILDAITGEATSRTEALADINQTLTSLSNANEAISQSITDLSAEFNTEILDAITGEATSRTEALADINQTLTSLTNANEANATSITNLSTSFSTEINNAVASEATARENAIAAEILARASAIQAVADSIPSEFDASGLATTADLQAETDARIGDIAAEATERARLLGIETTSRNEAISEINVVLNSLTTGDLALAEQISTLGTTFTTDLEDAITGETLARTTAIAGIEDSITALTTANEAVVLSVSNLGTKFEVDIDAAITGEADIRATAITNITNQIAALSDADSAAVTRVDTLEAQYTITDGSITGFSESSALKTVIDSAIATANQATVSSTTDLIAALEDQTAGVTTSISADINALTNKVNAQYTLEVNADGNVAGMRLGADETGSSISFTADSFKVSTGGPQGQLLTPFSIIDGQVAFNGAVSFSEGPQGPAGANGLAGPQGAAGANGLNGLDGSDGLPGAPGADGVSTYFHVAYADTASGGGFSQSPVGKLYIGTYVDNTQADAASGSSLWKWQLVKGADGENGENGIPGTNGADGQTSYLHIAYANNSSGTSGFSTTDSTGKLYLGTYTDFTLADSTDPTLYNWVLVKGADGLDGSDGLPGAPGADGVSTYFHVAYADNASGGGFSQSAAGKLYIGTYVDNTQADAASGSNLWKWQLVKGADGENGENGIPGTNGADGQTTYLHIAYANNSSGTSGFSTTVSTDKLYLGTYTDFTLADSTDPTLYNWVLVKGADGRDGVDGADGADGSAGANARAVNLTSTTQIFTYNSSGLIPSPVNTIITAAALNTSGTVYYQFFKNDASVQNGTSATYAYTPQSSFTSMPDKIEVQIREGSLTGTVLARDQITMAGIKPGANGSNGTNGANGADGMTVILSNEAHTLPTTSAGVVTYTGSGTTIKVFEGATELVYDGVGTSASRWKLTASPTSITTGSITDSGNFATIGNHSNMTANTALITYTITGKRANGASFSFTKAQSFAKSIQGATGPQGPAPDTSTYLTTSTTINGGQITTGIIKNGNFEAANESWDTYSSSGMGINLDLGAINSKNFYIDPNGNAKFKGDIEAGGTISGASISDFFEVDNVVDDLGLDLGPKLIMKNTAYIKTEVEGSGSYGYKPWTYWNDRTDQAYNSYTSLNDGFQSLQQDYNDFKQQQQNDGPTPENDPNFGPTTLSHNYIKRNDTVLEIGDLVKLNQNNELIKATSAKDILIVGILWKEISYSTETEKDWYYRDSFGNKIPLEDRDQKSIWQVAAIGDTVDVDTGLTGIKVCNQNGPVLKGDLLCSSDTPGYVMKQPTEWAIIGFDNGTPQYEERQIITSYTVGKCMVDCTFDSEGKTEGIYGYLYCG